MSANFYNRHRKLISVILVALFVVGGGLFANKICFSANGDTSVTLSAEELKALNNSGYQIVSGQYVYNPSVGQMLKQIIFGGNPMTSPIGSDAFSSAAVSLGTLLGSIDSLQQTNAQIVNSAKIQTEIDQAQALIDKMSPSAEKTAAQFRLDNAKTKQAEILKQANKAKDDAGSGSIGSTLGDIIGRMFSWILYGIAYALGTIFMLVTQVMLYVAVFNNFLNQPAVKAGWIITRDICNNFFIVFMMIMAIGSILQIQTYAWRAMLPKIILSAVLINFSMMFTGILIDLSQVIMLTFASPLATTKAYSIILGAFGLPDATKFSAAMAAISNNNGTAPAGLGWGDIIAALMFAILVTIVALCVTIAITCVLVYRIVMLWFLVILSPLWIFGKAFQKLEQITSEWMGMFTKMFIVGPAMMFFVYLSFLTMSTMSLGDNSQGNVLKVATTAGTPNGSFKAGDSVIKEIKDDKMNVDLVSLSKMGSVDGVINFLIICGLLFGSLLMGQRFGGAGAKFATQGMGWAKKFSGANLAQSLGKMGANRAKEFAGDITGISTATGAVGAYFGGKAKERKDAREVRIGKGAARIGATIGAAKEIAALPGKKLKDAYKYVVSGKSIAEANERIEDNKGKLATEEETLKAAETDRDKEQKRLDELKEKKNLTEEEIREKTAIQAKLQEFSTKSGSIASGAFTMGMPGAPDEATYSRDASTGTWKKTDGTGRVVKDNINEEDLQKVATGYEDDFDQKATKAKQAFVAGKTDEAFFEEGAYRYESLGGGNWKKVHKTTGASSNVNDSRLRLEAGRKVAVMAVQDEINAANTSSGNLDAQISAQEITVNMAESDAVSAKRQVDVRQTNIANNEEHIKSAQRRQAAVDKVLKYGMYGVAAATGGFAAPALLAGAALPTIMTAGVGVAAGAAAGRGVMGISEGIDNAGKADRKLASNMNASSIKSASEGLKDISEGEITTRLDDPTLSRFDKIALQMEAMNRGMLSVEKAKAAKEEILRNTSDYRGRDDKKVTSMLNSILERKYRSLTPTFSDYMSEPAGSARHSAAQAAIDDGINEGHYRMDALDNDALTATIERFAETLNFSAFKSQFEKMNEHQKELVKQSLIANQTALSIKAKGNLAKLTNISTAFAGDTAGAQRFVGGLNIKDLNEILKNGSKEQADALVKAVGKNISVLDERVQRQINSNTSDGKYLKVALGI